MLKENTIYEVSWALYLENSVSFVPGSCMLAVREASGPCALRCWGRSADVEYVVQVYFCFEPWFIAASARHVLGLHSKCIPVVGPNDVF